MRRSTHLLLLALPLVALTACDGLIFEPGGDFKVTLHTPREISRVQSVGPVEIDFDVQGCDQFEVFVSERTISTTDEQKLSFEPTDNGRFTTQIPQSWIWEPSNECGFNQNSVLRRSSLRVLCLDDDRSAISPFMDIALQQAANEVWIGRGEVEHVVSDGRGRAVSFGGGWISLIEDGQEFDEAVAGGEEGVLPKVASDDDGLLYVWIGCPLPRCENTRWDLEQGFIETVGTFIYAYDTSQGELELLQREALIIPSNAKSMRVDPQGRLVALSQTTNKIHVTTFGTRQEGFERQVVSFDDQGALTELVRRDDGTLVFMALDEQRPDRAWYHSPGQTPTEVSLPVEAPGAQLTLAPDGRRWTLQTRDFEVWMGSLDGSWTRLEVEGPPPLVDILGGVIHLDHLRVTWLDDAVAVYGTHNVEVFEAAPPHAQRYNRIIQSLDADPQRLSAPAITILEVRPAGAGVAVAINHGVRLLDADGTLKGGAEPLACGYSSSAMVGDDTLAVADGFKVLLLDL